MPDSLNKMMQMKNLNPDVDIIIGNVYEHKYKKTQYNIANPIVINNGIEARKWMLTHEYAVSAWNYSTESLLSKTIYFSSPGYYMKTFHGHAFYIVKSHLLYYCLKSLIPIGITPLPYQVHRSHQIRQ